MFNPVFPTCLPAAIRDNCEIINVYAVGVLSSRLSSRTVKQGKQLSALSSRPPYRGGNDTTGVLRIDRKHTT